MEIIIAIIIFIALFLIFRAVVLWYFRINEMAEAILEINKNIARMANESASSFASKSSDLNENKAGSVLAEETIR